MIYKLVIIESPAKCKKIESYLGEPYKCVASYGHLRELRSLTNIDVKNNFKTKYDVSDDKQKHINYLKSQIKNASEVLLATDDDREGEAIAWHICMLFDLPLDTPRIIYHEITEKALKKAIEKPTKLNMNMVHAQQTRQILDLLVGFKVSPKLWDNITKRNKNSLSAGRCQSPALRLVYDNQVMIDNNTGEKAYNTTGYFTNKCIPFELTKHHTSEDEMYTFLEESANYDHIYSRSERKKSLKSQPQPLTTSRIQQLASNEMSYSPKETMQLCQKLYEGGYITYMRTDSKKYSKDFVEATKKYILENYNDERYVRDDIHSLEINLDEPVEKEDKKKKKTKKTKGDNPPPQEAHEAIRPTQIKRKTLPEEMTPREKRMYKLIWETSLESCMSPAEYWTFTNSISGYEETKYTHTCELLDFLGWKIVKNKSHSETDAIYNYLWKQKEGTVIPFIKIESKLVLKNQKSHLTEARLVQILEDKGIGRPSTFSMLIDKIQERGYVKKQDVKGKEINCVDFELNNDFTITENEHNKEFGNEKNKLVLQPLGKIVIEFLLKHFDNLFNYEYTKNMEDKLDDISKGKQIWFNVCDECNNEIDDNCDKVPSNKISVKIENNHTYLIGKHGPVIKHTDKNNKVSFKEVKKDIELEKLERKEYSLEDILEEGNNNDGNEGIGEYEGEQVMIKKGKFGLFARWGDKSKSLTVFGNRPISNIRLEEVINVIEAKQESSITRVIDENLSIRKGKYGDYIFYKTSKMKKPSFFKLKGFEEDYKTCELGVLKSWIKNENNI